MAIEWRREIDWYWSANALNELRGWSTKEQGRAVTLAVFKILHPDFLA